MAGLLNLLGGRGDAGWLCRCFTHLRLFPVSYNLPPLGSRRGWGGVKKQDKKVFFDTILDNCIWFLHGIGFLFDFLRRCHLRQHAGQEVMSSHVLSCPMGAQGCTGPVGLSDNLEVL